MTFSTDTTYYRKSRQGESFIVSESMSLNANESTNVHLKNPGSSNKRLVVTNLNIGTQIPYTSTSYDKFSSGPSGGERVEIHNVLLDSGGEDDDGVAVANKDVSFTNGTSNHAVGVGGGGKGGNATGDGGEHVPIIMEPGREVVIKVQNDSSSAGGRASITLVYFETPYRA